MIRTEHTQGSTSTLVYLMALNHSSVQLKSDRLRLIKHTLCFDKEEQKHILSVVLTILLIHARIPLHPPSRFLFTSSPSIEARGSLTDMID